MGDDVKHFVLVHGVCHGSWCWYRLIALFKQAGHRVTALDLGACGINPKQLNEITSIWDYVHPLMEFMASLPQGESVILVGHSYAGLCISLAMESFPEKVSLGVFVTAYMPDFKSPPLTLIQEYFKRTPKESTMDCQLSLDSVLFGPDYMRTKVYAHCRSEDLELAKVLMRPNGLFMEDFSKEGMLTEEKYGSIDRVFIVCEEDEVMKEDFQRLIIEDSPPKEVILIREAGHMVMLSKPSELCQWLLEVAGRYHRLS
ncbi:methylesterase 10-like [Quercus robur]|uniref:methylesterase 10-like n=1 Tax=Quercus robur TaxID=38942 RepID=UPI0021624256|nr:methylesterase 10-like [Quercus robur]